MKNTLKQMVVVVGGFWAAMFALIVVMVTAPISIPMIILGVPFLIYFGVKVDKVGRVFNDPNSTKQQKWEASRDVLTLASAGVGLSVADGLLDGADGLFDSAGDMMDGATASVQDPGLAPEVGGDWAPIDDTYGDPSLVDGDPRNWHHVDSYTKADGTHVRGHWKSKAG